MVDNKNPETYDFDDPVCTILEDTRDDICKEILQNNVPCDQRRWNGKFSVQVMCNLNDKQKLDTSSRKKELAINFWQFIHLRMRVPG